MVAPTILRGETKAIVIKRHLDEPVHRIQCHQIFNSQRNDYHFQISLRNNRLLQNVMVTGL